MARIVAARGRGFKAGEPPKCARASNPVTELWNREAILKYLGREVERTRRHSGALGAIMAQVDQLAEISEQYGLAAGNRVLGEVARRLRGAIRIYDEIGHSRGDEFLLVLDLSKATAAQYPRLGDRLCLSVSQQPVETPDGELSVTVSLGLAVSSETKRLPPDQLLLASREALGRAQRAGGNRFEIAD
jgi:diguanylate cyclase (GGDEF)-like protein